jgi:hypothetical protein
MTMRLSEAAVLGVPWYTLQLSGILCVWKAHKMSQALSADRARDHL